MLPHFRRRLTERGLVWPDVLAVLDDAASVRQARPDRFGRDKYVVVGTASDGLGLEIVCVLDFDERGNLIVFITAY